MRTRALLAVASLLGIMGIAYAAASTQETSCSGAVVCPLNGETICADECPLNK